MQKSNFLSVDPSEITCTATEATSAVAGNASPPGSQHSFLSEAAGIAAVAPVRSVQYSPPAAVTFSRMPVGSGVAPVASETAMVLPAMLTLPAGLGGAAAWARFQPTSTPHSAE